MSELRKLKLSLFEKIKADLAEKISALDADIADLQESKNSDTKSSAGDKHETSREMAQIELENNQNQQLKLLNQRNDLNQIKLDAVETVVSFGSLVETSMGIFFISIGLGKINHEDQDFFVISMGSPIGQALFKKKVGEKATFQSKEIDILAIA
jgi:transcription elongation GreA/GreB family factor